MKKIYFLFFQFFLITCAIKAQVLPVIGEGFETLPSWPSSPCVNSTVGTFTILTTPVKSGSKALLCSRLG